MKKRVYAKEVTYGTILNEEVFVVKSLYEKAGYLCVLLSDRTGVVESVVKKSVSDISSVLLSNIGNVVSVSGVVLSTVKEGDNVPQLRISGCTVADSFRPEEVYDGISEETAKKHIAEIKRLIGMVTHPGYHALLEACLTEDALAKLATYPATHDFYGKYRGGALIATSAITNMVGNSGASYVRLGNGITTHDLCWDLLVTAALLHQVGKLRFFDECDPFKKTISGLMMNYYPLLQSMIEEAVAVHGIALSEYDKAYLLNVLDVATSAKTSTMTLFGEGIILRHMCHMYGELEYYQWTESSMEFDEDTPYVYNPRDNRHYFRMSKNPAIE